jgi:hypothetical protein
MGEPNQMRVGKSRFRRNDEHGAGDGSHGVN